MYKNYLIGDCCFQIEGEKLAYAVKKLYGFDVFATDERREPEFYVFLYEGKNVPQAEKRLYGCKTDRVVTTFSSLPDGHLLEMHHEDGRCLNMWSKADERTVCLKGDLSAPLLRFALWVGYGLMTVHSYRIAIHSSCIIEAGRAFLFLGESGTGKSTHTGLWREYIPGAILLNDDSPIVAVENEKIWVYGSPWSGKTPCYKQERYPLCGCVRLSQAPYNRIKKLLPLNAYAAIHPSCPPEFAYDQILYNGISNTLDRVLSSVPFYHLECLPDRDAALLSYTTLFEYCHEKDSE